jgi:hypothetical protein
VRLLLITAGVAVTRWGISVPAPERTDGTGDIGFLITMAVGLSRVAPLTAAVLQSRSAGYPHRDSTSYGAMVTGELSS